MTGFFASIVRCFNTPCTHCSQPGASLSCRHGKCRASFHFHCAIAASCLFTSDMRVYCSEHADKVKKSNRHEVGSILRRMTVRVPRLETKDGQVVGLAKTMEVREAEMVVDGEWKGRRAFKRKLKGQGHWRAKKKIETKEEDKRERDLKEEKREEGEEGDEEEDEEEEEKSALHASSNGDGAEFSAVKQERMDEDAPPSSSSPTPSDRFPPSSYHLRIGSLTIQRLGTVSSHPGLHSSHFLYPDSFSSSRVFHSYRRLHQRTVYHCVITLNNDSPLFTITPDDDALHPVSADSASLAFSLLLARFKPSLAVHQANSAMSAPYFFGFGHPTVMELLEGEHETERLTVYERIGGRKKSDTSDGEEDAERQREKERQQREVEELQLAMSTVIQPNPTGSARTEGYQGKTAKPHHKANFSSSITSSSSPSPAPPSFTDSAPLDKRRKAALVDSSSQHLSLASQYRAMKHAAIRARVGHSPIHEWGLYATEALEPGSMVIEYLGETIRQKVADVREKRYEELGIGSCYMFRIDDDLIVDATKRGNIGRFINHSCDPCCVTKIIEYGGEKKIVVITTRRVELGEEITYNYFFANEADRISCNCGARNCAGRLN